MPRTYENYIFTKMIYFALTKHANSIITLMLPAKENPRNDQTKQMLPNRGIRNYAHPRPKG